MSKSSDTDYLVNQKKEQDEHYGVVLEDLTISVAVNAAQLETVTRDSILAMAGNASGISEDLWTSKITVVNAPFYQREGAVEQAVSSAVSGITLQPWMLIAAGGLLGFILILALVVAILSGRRKKKRLEAERAAMEAEEAQAAILRQRKESVAEQAAAAKELDPTEQLVQQVRDFTADNPDISAQLLKSWLRGGNENES